jgi:hypothetical protein
VSNPSIIDNAAAAAAHKPGRLRDYVAQNYDAITQRLNAHTGRKKDFWDALATELSQAKILGVHGITNGTIVEHVWFRERDRRQRGVAVRREQPREVVAGSTTPTTFIPISGKGKPT